MNARDMFGYPPLMRAVQGGNTEITQLLLDAGADVNAENNNGKTALMLALEYGHTEVVELIRKAGAQEY